MRTATALLLSAALAPAGAQIAFDGTLGPAGALTGPDYLIPADAGQRLGGNLFHSFSQFNVNTGESATFTGPATVDNVIGRVTGGEVSAIDGVLGSTIDGADLYLVNPAGVVFGPDASLDVQGSFFVSTADYLSLEDGGRFDAAEPARSILSVAPVSAFGFLDDAPAPVTIAADLAVPDRQTLAVAAGDIVLDSGSLTAAGGRLWLAGAAAAGELVWHENGSAGGSLSEFGDIVASRFGLYTSAAGGGQIAVRGGRVSFAGSELRANSDGGSNGIGITVDATVVELSGGSVVQAATAGDGSAGSVNIAARSLRLTGGSAISTATVGPGRGGDVALGVGELVIAGTTADGRQRSGIFADTAGTGAAGDVEINATSVSVLDGGVIQSAVFGSGHGGSLTINTTDLRVAGSGPESNSPVTQLTTATAADAAGNAGDIAVSADTLEVTGGGVISSATAGTGQGGNIAIGARRVRLAGITADGRRRSGITALARGRQPGSGDAGSVTINAGTIEVSAGAAVSSGTLGPGAGGDVVVNADGVLLNSGRFLPETAGWLSSGIFSLAENGAAGGAGNITIDTGNLSLLQGATINASTDGSGRGGNIDINARQRILMSGAGDGPGGAFRSGIGAVSLGDQADSGDAGNITLRAETITLLGDTSVSGVGRNAGGGNVTVNAGQLLLDGNSEVSASAGGAAPGGNVSFFTDTLVALEDSQINASADQGLGGNIRIFSQVFLSDRRSDLVLDATSMVQGNDGSVAVNTPGLDVSASLTALPVDFLTADRLLDSRCGQRGDTTASRFLVSSQRLGRAPDDWLDEAEDRTAPCPPAGAGR